MKQDELSRAKWAGLIAFDVVAVFAVVAVVGFSWRSALVGSGIVLLLDVLLGPFLWYLPDMLLSLVERRQRRVARKSADK